GPYSTDLPTLDDIRQLLELERVMVDRTIKSQTITLTPNQILTKELSPDIKQWEELIRENVFGLGGHRDHLPACLAHMLYCVVAEEQTRQHEDESCVLLLLNKLEDLKVIVAKLAIPSHLFIFSPSWHVISST
ncbi:hypothetical protein Tco_0131071, partial [Tanacetum coccineum]